MDQRQEFVLRSLGDEGGSFAALCRAYGITPKTGYKWRQRFMAQGLAGLADHPRRPRSSPAALSEAVVCRIVRLRLAHPSWGARKLRALYRRATQGPAATAAAEPLPSESSFKRVLDRAGLVVHRPTRRPAQDGGRLQQPPGRRVAAAPNELWTVDFKGWWYTPPPQRQRCEPLTVRDAFSRYVLCASLPADARTGTIRAAFERLFRHYGLPQTIRSDNGRPFACTRAPLGLSRLSAWWVALGIDLDRIAPGHPEQNGAHERMHRDLAAEVQAQVAGRDDWSTQGAALDLWRHSYNQERPHEALGMRTPAELYQPSVRRYTGTPDRLAYGPGFLERQVHPRQGTISIEHREIRLSQSLGGWTVGLRPIVPGVYSVYFGRLCLGRLDVADECLRPSGPVVGVAEPGQAV